jgi:hypothetical protein
MRWLDDVEEDLRMMRELVAGEGWLGEETNGNLS